jgi:CheY-like chemotaxis protein
VGRVLVIEDNRDGADSLRYLLEMMGHEARASYTGPEGLQAAKEWLPDLVLCDIGLPGMDGWAIAKELRQDPATTRIRLIALTGYNTPEDRLRSQQAGFERHFAKPVDFEVLQRHWRCQLSRSVRLLLRPEGDRRPGRPSCFRNLFHPLEQHLRVHRLSSTNRICSVRPGSVPTRGLPSHDRWTARCWPSIIIGI